MCDATASEMFNMQGTESFKSCFGENKCLKMSMLL